METSISAAKEARLFGGCAAPSGSYDELRDGEGAIRAPWRPLVDHVCRVGLEEMIRRERTAHRQLQENGSTYNVHGDTGDGDHPWQLDALPYMVAGSEWARLSAGLAQRARLLDALLSDLYGAQRCLKEGWLPPDLIFEHPGFLRPCHGVRPPGGAFLHLYAADLARGPDGDWIVLGDLTQAPAGAGYVLENRITLSRVLPSLFRDCQVERLARFFHTLRETLLRLSPRRRDNPRVVMLSAGPRDEAYFEQAYLARYLGYPLVEGEDLAVREQSVFLKMLGGLQPVDVLLRRVDDFASDPLEFQHGSAGVPGLQNAARCGQVAVANALGSGVLEAPALLPFLPELSRRLLAEELALTSAPTRWLGDPAACEDVLAHLEDYAIAPAFTHNLASLRVTRPLAAAERAELIARVRAHPRRFVAQSHVALSTAPVLAGDHVAGRPIFLRAFAAASADGFAVMPGGLARAVETAEVRGAALHRGGVSKDTWVLSDQPVSVFSLLSPAGAPIELSRGGGDLPSRVADNLFWLGRYVERADYLIRIARVLLLKLSERPVGTELPHLGAWLKLIECAPPVPGSEADYARIERDVLAVLFDPARPGGLRQTVDEVVRVAALARERLSADTWRMLNRIELNLHETDAGPAPALGDSLFMLDRIIVRLAAFGGMSMESMTRGQGWRFLDMGRRMERSIQTVALVEQALCLIGPGEAELMEEGLGIADSAMTYRRRYLTALQAAPVLDLLLTDETNPRSLAFQLEALADHVKHLPRPAEVVGPSDEERSVLRMQSMLRLADVRQWCEVVDGERRTALIAFLADMTESLPALSDVITRQYLSHAKSTRQLESMLAPGDELPRPASNHLPLQ